MRRGVGADRAHDRHVGGDDPQMVVTDQGDHLLLEPLGLLELLLRKERAGRGSRCGALAREKPDPPTLLLQFGQSGVELRDADRLPVDSDAEWRDGNVQDKTAARDVPSPAGDQERRRQERYHKSKNLQAPTRLPAMSPNAPVQRRRETPSAATGCYVADSRNPPNRGKTRTAKGCRAPPRSSTSSRRSRHRDDDLAPMIARAKEPKGFRQIGQLVRPV